VPFWSGVRPQKDRTIINHFMGAVAFYFCGDFFARENRHCNALKFMSLWGVARRLRNAPGHASTHLGFLKTYGVCGL
jgi:hypothetical protein